jgi:4-amino-4-deoxy-L-arabinose transferase-like glycosyltransferase
LSLCFFAFALILARPKEGWPGALSGMAAGIAVSSKYAAGCFLAGGLLVSMFSPNVRHDLRRCWPILVGSALVTLAFINFRALITFDTLLAAMARELGPATTGDRGWFRWPIHSPVYLKALLNGYSVSGAIAMAGTLIHLLPVATYSTPNLLS